MSLTSELDGLEILLFIIVQIIYYIFVIQGRKMPYVGLFQIIWSQIFEMES